MRSKAIRALHVIIDFRLFKVKKLRVERATSSWLDLPLSGEAGHFLHCGVVLL